MQDAPELHSALNAAERAAAAGDHASAEQLLRKAARLQERALGPFHSDLANTLNNLGIVCENAGKPVEAEECYRRAYAIAKATLAPNHPFVATSEQNLRDFCKARGIPFEATTPAAAPTPASAPPVAASSPVSRPTMPSSPAPVSRDRPVTTSAERREARTAPSAAPSPSESRTVSYRGLAIGVAIACALLFLLTVAIPSRQEPIESKVEPSSPPSRAEGTSPAPRSPSSSTGQDGPESSPAPPAVEASPSPVDPVSPPPAPALEVARAASQSQAAEIADRGGQLLAVTQAELCRSLATGGEGGWRCDSVTSPVEPGPLVFYIRVRSATDRTIQHRWYRDDRLSRAVDLRIAANTGAGYRTYSRNTVTGSGDWRVEVTTGDGTLLAEERFTVR